MRLTIEEKACRLRELEGFSPTNSLEQRWEHKIEAVEGYEKRNGRLPYHYSKNTEVRSLNCWCNHQKEYRCKGKLSRERQRRLELIRGWKWDAGRDREWNCIFQEVRAYAGKVDKLPPQHHKCVKIKKLGIWCAVQRRLKRRRGLLEKRRKKLESIPIWSWNKYEDGWDYGFKEVKNYIKKTGTLPSKKSKNTKTKKLGQWCSTQRCLKRENNLSKKKQNKLESISIWCWDIFEEAFYFNLDRVKNYVKEKGKLPCRSVGGVGVGILIDWCSGQRKSKRKGRLSEERQKHLESIKGWWWDKNMNDGWISSFEKTKSCVEIAGELPSVSSSDIEVKKLGDWCHNQRRKKRMGKLSEER